MWLILLLGYAIAMAGAVAYFNGFPIWMMYTGFAIAIASFCSFSL